MRVQAYTPGDIYVLLVEIWATDDSLGRVDDVELVRRAVWSFAGPVMVP